MGDHTVLYLSYDGLTDPLGQSQILPYLIGLRRDGYPITIISFEKPVRFAEAEGTIRNICTKHDIEWKPLPYHKDPPVLSTLFDLARLRCLIRALRKSKTIAIVHCRSYIMALIGLWMKRKFRTKFLFDMRGFWADERVEGGIWKLHNPVFFCVYHYFKKKEKQFVQEADSIIVLTESARRELTSWNIITKSITVIPTCVDLTLFDPSTISTQQQQERRQQLGFQPDDIVISYLGSWGTWYRTQEVLTFFSELKKFKREAKLLIISNDKPSLLSFEFAQDVRVVKASRSDVPLLLSICRMCVCFIMPTYSKRASSATKMAEAWAMNLPVVTNAGWGDIEMLEKDYPILLYEGAKDIEKVLPAMDAGYSLSGIQLTGGIFDLREGIKSMSQVYKSMTS